MDWIFPILAGKFVEKKEITIQKKIRDDVLLKSAELPFRRSSLYFCLKVFLNLRLEKEFGKNEGKIYYKSLILYILCALLNDY